ncbi:MAG: DUF192 domain-containing protein [Candidatus Omnitrophica bacterium]|nr:DUF192 domain-containing protein [Candidatus Omnitrophota bacterium]
MRMHWLFGVVLLASWLGAGCHQSATTLPPVTDESFSPTAAQPKLPTITLWVGPQKVTAEVARTSRQLATGMMFRKEMGENEGMLFVFGQPLRASFYMRNTTIPLSCAYIDSDGVILEIHKLKPLDETPVEAASDLVRFVLEMPQGWFERHQVTIGAVVAAEDRSLRETFFGPQ